jgi:integrase
VPIKWHKTQFQGVRYREHPSRKHNGRPDRYFTIRYKIDGKLKEESIGWASQEWNAQTAALQRNELIRGQKMGNGPITLSEKRLIAKNEREAKREEKERIEKEKTTFGIFFDKTYCPNAKANISERSYQRIESLGRLWIKPIIGDFSFSEISPLHLETIKVNMAEAGKAARTIRYALAVVRQTFNYARYVDLYNGPSPIHNVRMPQADNKRLRFLTHEESKKLLKELQGRSQQLYEISLISLRTGARADEVFSIKWSDVDLEHGLLTLWDTKNTKTRIAYMTGDVKELFKNKKRGDPNELVFPGRGGRKITSISKAFERAVDEIGLNDEITDPRMKVVFHSLRHTFASWLVEKGEDLYVVNKLMGHSSLAMTERYSHVGNNTLQAAVRKLEEYDLTLGNASNEMQANISEAAKDQKRVKPKSGGNHQEATQQSQKRNRKSERRLK